MDSNHDFPQVIPSMEMTTPAAIFQMDGSLVFRAAAPSTAKLLGHTKSDSLLGTSLGDLFSEKTALAAFRADLKAYAESNPAHPFRSVLNLQAHNGRQLWLELVALTQPQDDGLYLNGYFQDLTAQQGKIQALHVSEVPLRLLVERAQDIIFKIDTISTRIASLNPAFETVTGWARADWIDKSFTPLVHPDDLAHALNAIQNDTPSPTDVNLELRIRSRAGRYITIEFSTSLHQESDETTYWFGIARNITARKQAEAATKRYLQRLQTLHKIDRAVLLVQSPEEVAFVALSHLTNLVPCDYANIMILDFEADEAEIVTEYRDDQLLLGQGDHIHISDLALPRPFMQGQINHLPNLREGEWGTGDKGTDEEEAVFRFARRSIDQLDMRTVINLPLLSRDVMVGVLTLAAYRPQAFSDDSVEIAGEVANQLAVSLHGVQSLKAEERARHTAETLSAASMALTQTLQVDLLVEGLLDYLRRLVPYDLARVYLLDLSTLHLSAVRPSSYTSPNEPKGQDLQIADYPGLTLLSEKEGGMVIGDLATIQKDPGQNAGSDGVAVGQFWPSSPGMRSWLGVPLIAQGRTIGLYVIEHATPNFFLDHHVRAAEALAAQTSIALTNAQLLAERQEYAVLLEDRVAERTAALQRSNGLIAALSQVATRVQNSLDPQRAIDTLGEELRNLLGVSSMVALLDNNSQALNIRYYTQDDRTLDILDKITLQGPQGPQLTREHWPLFTDLVDQNRTLFLPDAMMRAFDQFFDPEDPAIVPMLAAAGITQDIKSIFLPLTMEDRVLGVLLLWGETLQEIDIPAIKIFAGQIAAALEMSRLHAQVQSERVAEQEALLRLSQALLSEVDVGATSQQALNIVAETFQPDLAAIMLLDPDGRHVFLSAGLGWTSDITDQPIDLGENSIISYVLHGDHNNRPVIVADTEMEERFTLPQPLQEHRVVSGISTPMIAGNRRLGVLSIYWQKPRNITEDESRLLILIGNTTAQSIARAQLYEAEQQARHIADILRMSNMTLTQSLDMSTVIETFLTTLQDTIPYDSGNVIMMENESQMSLYAHRGYENWTDTNKMSSNRFDLADFPLIQRAVTTKKPVIVNKTLKEPDWRVMPMSEHVQSWLGIPLIAGGKVVGLYGLDKAEPDFFTESHLQLAESLGAQAASAIQNAWLYKEVTAGQERLRTLTRRLVDIQETERSRVAQSLHEGVGQYLTGLSLHLKTSTQVEPEALARQLNDARTIVNDLTTQVREMSLALRPTLLDDMGLQPALAWLFERYTKQTGLTIDFVHRGLHGQRLPAPVETAAFRILQEILTDLEEYQQQGDALLPPTGDAQRDSAQEKQLHIRVWEEAWEEAEALQISVIDPKGVCGLAKALQVDNANNLYNLKERASLLDGDLVLAVHPSGDTQLSGFLPLVISGDK